MVQYTLHHSTVHTTSRYSTHYIIIQYTLHHGTVHTTSRYSKHYIMVQYTLHHGTVHSTGTVHITVRSIGHLEGGLGFSSLHVEALRALGRRPEVRDFLLDSTEPDLVLGRQLEVRQTGAGAIRGSVGGSVAVLRRVSLEAESLQPSGGTVTNTRLGWSPLPGARPGLGPVLTLVPALEAGPGAGSAQRVLRPLPRRRPLVVLKPGGGACSTLGGQDER